MTLSKSDHKKIEALLNRKPSIVETHIFDTMWSEHCSYKSTKPVLKTLPTKGSEVALGVGEDAGIIRFAKHKGKQYCIAVSHESHNHPSQILPIEGAATGVGGCVRDVYCMGADVIGVLNSLHFGVNDGSKPIVDEIAEKVVLGISDYGNPLGVPVLGGETLYHPSYNDNCLVNVSAIGLIEETDIIHSYAPKEAAQTPYDVILIGKSTDATGFGGASFSSATLDDDNEANNIGAVQVHDPFLKRVVVEAIKEMIQFVKKENIPIGFKDLGAGGISCATSEIAVGGGFGITLDLNKVNVSLSDLPPEVIACSETQERFCLVAPKAYSKRICDIFNKQFEMPKLYPKSGAVVVGSIINEPQFKIYHHNECVCDLPVTAITTDVSENRVSQQKNIVTQATESSIDLSLNQAVIIGLELLNKQNNQSKHSIYSFFDNAVKGNTIIYPGEADAVVITPIKGANQGLAVTMDSNLYGHIDPYTSGAYAVAESVRNVIAVGGRPLALTDCLNYGNPEKPSVFFDFEQGVKGIKEAAIALSMIENEPIPIVSGNVSLYNESKNGNAIIPSPVVMCIAKIEDYHHALTMQVRKPDAILIRIGSRYAEFGGTQLSQLIEVPNKEVAPQVRTDEEAIMNKLVLELIQKKQLLACHDISIGGVWQSLVEMMLGEHGKPKVGMSLDFSNEESLSEALFSENGGYILAAPTSNIQYIQKALDQSGCCWRQIGKTTAEIILKLEHNNHAQSLTVNQLATNWQAMQR